MFGKRIKEIRKKSGLNQSEFAKILQCSQANVAKFESQQLDLSTAMIVKICKTFNVSADYLLGLED